MMMMRNEKSVADFFAYYYQFKHGWLSLIIQKLKQVLADFKIVLIFVQTSSIICECAAFSPVDPLSLNTTSQGSLDYCYVLKGRCLKSLSANFVKST